jgi:hypothetical protein
MWQNIWTGNLFHSTYNNFLSMFIKSCINYHPIASRLRDRSTRQRFNLLSQYTPQATECFPTVFCTLPLLKIFVVSIVHGREIKLASFEEPTIFGHILNILLCYRMVTNSKIHLVCLRDLICIGVYSYIIKTKMMQLIFFRHIRKHKSLYFLPRMSELKEVIQKELWLWFCFYI